MVNKDLFKSMACIEQEAKKMKETAKTLKNNTVKINPRAIVGLRECLASMKEEIDFAEHVTDTAPSAQSRLVENLDLSNRTKRILRRAGINNIDDLCSVTAGDLMRYRCFGAVCLKEVETTLAEMGLSLKAEEK